MRAPTHSLGGAAGWLAVCVLLPVPAGAVAGGAIVAALAAPLPDLDNLGTWSRKRKYSRRKQPVRYWATKLGLWSPGPSHPVKRPVSWVLTRLGTHRRGPAHSLLGGVFAAALFTWPAAWLTWFPLWVPAAVLAGVWSHLALDLANERPIRLFWPFTPLVHGLPAWFRCRVGGWGEIVWRFGLAGVFLACLSHISRAAGHG